MIAPLDAVLWIPAAAMVGTPSVEIGGTLRVAIIQGDPMTAGHTYTLRISCTDGAKIAPHWHPTTENVTVIKGTFLVGMGAKWDDAAMKEIPAGGFVSAPSQMRHYGQCKGDCVVQVNGIARIDHRHRGIRALLDACLKSDNSAKALRTRFESSPARSSSGGCLPWPFPVRVISHLSPETPTSAKRARPSIVPP